MLEYKIGNRKVSKTRFNSHLNDVVHNMAAEAVVSKVESIRCPKHGKRVKAAKTTRKGKNIGLEFSGCCDEAISRAQSALR